jgi:hypothetical protein
MATLFLTCAVLGGSVLVLQLAGTLLGLDHPHDVDAQVDGHDVAAGFNLFTVRSLAAAVAFFGIGGRAALASGLDVPAATAIGAGVGALAALGVAAAMRLLRNFDSDGVVLIERAVGQEARVHVKIPGGVDRPGKVLLTVQDRLLELPAVSLEGELPTGTPVIVVGVAGGDTVEVVRTPDPGV